MDPQVYNAAKLGDITLLQQVVTKDSSRLLRVTPNKNTALHVSVRFGHIEFVKEVYSALLQHNSSLEGNTEYNKSLSLLTQGNSEDDIALRVAVREGHHSITKFLLEKIEPWPSDLESGNSTSLDPEKIRMRNKDKNTALHEAVRRNDLEMVKLLSEADPDLGHPNYDADAEGHGESPLYLAAKDGRLDILNQILLICPSPAHGGPHGQTALHVAIVNKRLDVVKILLEKKREVLVNEADKDGRTALHYAVSKRCIEIIQELLRHDTSSAYKLDKDGLSPLHIAALESSIKIFRELIKRCPDSGKLLDKKRRNVLHFAVMSRDFKAISFALKQQELRELINKPDDDGNTAFHLAATLGYLWRAKPFRSNGRVDVKATNKKGQTAAENFQLIHAGNTMLKLVYQRYMARIFWPSDALKGREHEWIRGGAKKEQICSDPSQDKVPKSQKEMGKTLLIVASLLATVAFTAVFQVPGGYNVDNGNPILKDNGYFLSFMMFDSAALSLSLMTLIVMFLARVADDYFYSTFLKMGTFLICLAILFTSAAFYQGLKAVLPSCDDHAKFICSPFSFDVGQSFTSIATLIFTYGVVPFVYGSFLFDAGTFLFCRSSPMETRKNVVLLFLGVIFFTFVAVML